MISKLNCLSCASQWPAVVMVTHEQAMFAQCAAAADAAQRRNRCSTPEWDMVFSLRWVSSVWTTGEHQPPALSMFSRCVIALFFFLISPEGEKKTPQDSSCCSVSVEWARGHTVPGDWRLQKWNQTKDKHQVLPRTMTFILNDVNLNASGFFLGCIQPKSPYKAMLEGCNQVQILHGLYLIRFSGIWTLIGCFFFVFFPDFLLLAPVFVYKYFVLSTSYNWKSTCFSFVPHFCTSTYFLNETNYDWKNKLIIIF